MIAVILAAGLSTRFNGKKLLQIIYDKPMIYYVTNLVNSFDFKQKILIYSDEEVINAIPAIKSNSDFQIYLNEHAKEGLSTSIRLALKHMNNLNQEEGIMFFVADQPFLNMETIDQLVVAFHQKKGSIIVPVYAGKRGNPVIFSTRWIKQLQELKGDIGGRDIIKRNPNEVYEVIIDDDIIGKDIDTKEEYKVLKGERNTKYHE